MSCCVPRHVTQQEGERGSGSAGLPTQYGSHCMNDVLTTAHWVTVLLSPFDSCITVVINNKLLPSALLGCGAQVGTWYSRPSAASDADGAGGGVSALPQPVRSGVGKYISTSLLSSRQQQTAEAATGQQRIVGDVTAAANGSGEARREGEGAADPPAKKPKVAAGGFGNFDSW